MAFMIKRVRWLGCTERIITIHVCSPVAYSDVVKHSKRWQSVNIRFIIARETRFHIKQRYTRKYTTLIILQFTAKLRML